MPRGARTPTWSAPRSPRPMCLALHSSIAICCKNAASRPHKEAANKQWREECLPLMLDYLDNCMHMKCPRVDCAEWKCVYTKEQEELDRRMCLEAVTMAGCPGALDRCMKYRRNCYCASMGDQSWDILCRAYGKAFIDACKAESEDCSRSQCMSFCDRQQTACEDGALAVCAFLGRKAFAVCVGAYQLACQAGGAACRLSCLTCGKP